MTACQKGAIVQRMPQVPVLEALASLPPMASSDYHPQAALLASSLAAADIVQIEAAIGDESGTELGFHAFYVLLARHRRTLDASRFRSLYQKHAARFAHIPMRAVLDSDMAMLDPAGSDLATALRHAERAVQQLPGNQALVAHHARVMAEYAWSGGEVPAEELRSVLRSVDRAIESDPQRPRYRAVRAQLTALLDEFDNAVRAIDRALDLEDSTQLGYEVRIVEYHRIRADIILRREVKAVRSQAKEAASRVEEAMRAQLEQTAQETESRLNAEIGRLRSETLGSLGLLAAVIAFIVSTTQVADRQPVGEALRLLTGIAGVLALVFTAFGTAFGTGRPVRLLVPAVLGAVLLAGALLV